MEKHIVDTKQIPFRTLLDIIDAVDTLRAGLEDLDRVNRGALNSHSKGKVLKLVMQFKAQNKNMVCDNMLDLAIKNMILIAETISETSSTDGSGYTIIERNVAMLFYQIGFIKGIRFTIIIL